MNPTDAKALDDYLAIVRAIDAKDAEIKRMTEENHTLRAALLIRHGVTYPLPREED